MQEAENTDGVNASRSDQPASGLFDDARELGDDFAALARDATKTKQQVKKLFHRRVAKNPYAALATAAGVGFVLAGGLSPALLRTAGGFAGRIAILLLTKRAVAMLDGSRSTGNSADKEKDRSERPRRSEGASHDQ